jgi:hypothetical protein
MNRNNHKTVLTILVGFLILYFIFNLKTFVYLSFLVGLISLVSNYLMALIVLIWTKLAEGLGWVNSRILLTIVFFVILVPIAFISRFFSNKSMTRKPNNNSFYQTRNHTYISSDLENIW